MSAKFLLQPIKDYELKESNYEDCHSDEIFSASYDGKFVGYVSFHLKEDDKSMMWLNMIEVMDKRKGLGKAIIQHLIDTYELSIIEGLILCETTAYSFWKSMGARIYYIHEEGYSIDELIDSDLESAFMLYA